MKRLLPAPPVTAAALAAAVGFTLACAHPFHFPPPVSPEPGYIQVGIASWYGPAHDGRRTSSGEVFHQDALTAAHPSFTFGTLVRVTLVSTGRSVVVRINDRFPAYKGRIIDVSRGAARRIGLIGPGTGRVRLEVVTETAAELSGQVR